MLCMLWLYYLNQCFEICTISRLLFRNDAITIDGTYAPHALRQDASSRKKTLCVEAGNRTVELQRTSRLALSAELQSKR
jgi:hypothetical protein